METEAPAASAVSEIESSSSDDERSEEGSVRPAGAGARTGAGTSASAGGPGGSPTLRKIGRGPW